MKKTNTDFSGRPFDDTILDSIFGSNDFVEKMKKDRDKREKKKEKHIKKVLKGLNKNQVNTIKPVKDGNGLISDIKIIDKIKTDLNSYNDPFFGMGDMFDTESDLNKKYIDHAKNIYNQRNEVLKKDKIKEIMK